MTAGDVFDFFEVHFFLLGWFLLCSTDFFCISLASSLSSLNFVRFYAWLSSSFPDCCLSGLEINDIMTLGLVTKSSQWRLFLSFRNFCKVLLPAVDIRAMLLGSWRLTFSSLSCLMFPPSDQTMDPLWLSLTRFWFDSLHCNCDLPNANRICLIFAIKTDHSLFHQVTPFRFSSRRPIWLVLFVITWRCDRSSNSVVCVLSREI